MALLVGAWGVSHGMRKNALRMAGSALDVMREPERFASVLGAQGVRAVRAQMRDAQQTLNRLAEMGAEIVAMGDEEYPEMLTKIARAPHVLFVLGKRDLRHDLPIAIVGTRSASEYGLTHARAIATGLVAGGACIVSGLALGIDAAAHEGAVEAGGPTVAVLGGGLDCFYPEANRGLMERILATGGSVITEYPLGVKPTRYTFLQRNRIIVGLSKGVLVVEGPQHSGAMGTAHCAMEEGRELYALPGDVDKPNSVLPNLLIAEGAHPATCADDILLTLDRVVPPVGLRLKRMMARRDAKEKAEKREAEPPAGKDEPAQSEAKKPARGKKPRAKKASAARERDGEAATPAEEAPVRAEDAAAREAVPLGDARGAEAPDAVTAELGNGDAAADMAAFGALGAQERAVLAALAEGELDFDALCARTGLGADVLGGMLVMLELDGYIRILPGLRYARA